MGFLVTSLLNNLTLPAVADFSPEITLNKVVLPAPFGPIIETRSPCLKFIVISVRACSPVNHLETF